MPKRPKRTPEMQRRINLMGRRIAAARARAGLRMIDVVEMMGEGYPRGRTWLSEIEQGRNSVDAINLQRIAEVLDCPIAYFIDPHYDEAKPRWPRTRGEWIMFASGDTRLGTAVWNCLQEKGLAPNQIATYTSQ